MKYWFIPLLLLLGHGNIHCQTEYPQGAYMSLEELRDKLPSENYELLPLLRTDGDIVMMGGNDYKLISEDKSIKNKIIKKQIFAFSDGSDLFVNCFQFGCQFWYAKVNYREANIIRFNAGMSNSKATSAAMMGGAIGGAIAATQRYLYEVDLNTGELKFIEKVKK